MGWRFRRTKTLVPGVRVNIGKRALSLRFGLRGLGYTIGTAGQRITAGIPGTGLSYTRNLDRTSGHGVGVFGVLVFLLLIVGLVVWLAAH
jgi:hypothetical protein